MRRKRIAILMASIDREYQSDFVRGAFAAAKERNIDVCVLNCQGYMNVDVSISGMGESAIFHLPGIQDFDGIISLPETFADGITLHKVRKTLRSLSGKPHVSIDLPADGAVSIRFDDKVSVRQLTEHLIEKHGVSKFVYLSGPQKNGVAMARLQAFRETVEAHGLSLAPEDIFEGEWINSSGWECAEKLLQRPEGLPEAVVCGNDDMAFGVSEYLGDQGYRIPEDILVTGFDALREAISRGLTTIRRPIDQAAREAVRVLDMWMTGNVPDQWEIVLPTIPMYEESCGCILEQADPRPRTHSMRTERRQRESLLLQTSMFNGSLASVADEQDAREKIDQFVRTLGISELYLCVNPALTRENAETPKNSVYPERMLLLYGRDGKRSLPPKLFDTRQMVPVMEEERNRPLGLIFCPLYYREQRFGYLAMDMNQTVGVALYSVLMLFNGALTSLYFQSSMRRYVRKMADMSVHDIMTGMLNRRGFMEKSPELLEQCRQEEKFFVMISADMDDMKKINDQYGHQTGDQAIIRMGRAMQKLEELNMTPVHISGDEFLSYGMADTQEEAESILVAAHEGICRLNAEEPWIVETGASIGMYAAVPKEGETIDVFLTRADHAMYEEKNRKKGTL